MIPFWNQHTKPCNIMLEKGGKYDFFEITNFQHPGLYAPESPVCLCASQAVDIEKGRKISYYFSFEMHISLDSTIHHALHSLLDATDSADIVAEKIHPRDSDVAKWNLHRVHQIKINEVSFSMMQFGASDGKRNFPADEREVRAIFNLDFCCLDVCHFI